MSKKELFSLNEEYIISAAKLLQIAHVIDSIVSTLDHNTNYSDVGEQMQKYLGEADAICKQQSVMMILPDARGAVIQIFNMWKKTEEADSSVARSKIIAELRTLTEAFRLTLDFHMSEIIVPHSTKEVTGHIPDLKDILTSIKVSAAQGNWSNARTFSHEAQEQINGFVQRNVIIFNDTRGYSNALSQIHMAVTNNDVVHVNLGVDQLIQELDKINAFDKIAQQETTKPIQEDAITKVHASQRVGLEEFADAVSKIISTATKKTGQAVGVMSQKTLQIAKAAMSSISSGQAKQVKLQSSGNIKKLPLPKTAEVKKYSPAA